MKQFIILLFLFFLNASFIQAQQLEQQKKWEFKKWPQMFKERAFCLCLLEGYGDSSIKKSILRIDRSYYDPIGISIFDSTLLPLIKSEVETINLNAKRSYSTVSEAGAGRRVFDHCLSFYRSKRLDLLLKKTEPQWRKIINIDDEVYRHIPTF